MAYKVRFTLTKATADQDAASALALDNPADVGLVDTYMTNNGGSKEITDHGDGVTTSVVYTFANNAAWQAFYNQALPVWNRNSYTSKASNAGITLDVSVVENT